MSEENRFGAVHCNVCGHIQGVQFVGGVMMHKDAKKKFTQCQKCGKRVRLTVETVLFTAKTAKEASDWVMRYKSSLNSLVIRNE